MIQWLIAALLGGGILGFIQFLISRSDKKKDSNNEVLTEIRSLKEDVDGLRGDFNNLREHTRERETVSARNHILRFNDELINGIDHSHEYFLEMMDDIGVYEKYCKSHPDFPNGRTDQACENIKMVYHRLFTNGKFKE